MYVFQSSISFVFFVGVAKEEEALQPGVFFLTFVECMYSKFILTVTLMLSNRKKKQNIHDAFFFFFLGGGIIF
jgi:hypothetical protein